MVPAKFYLPPDPEEMSRRFQKHVSKPAPGGVKLQRKVESTERKKVRDLVPHPAPPCPTLPHPTPPHSTLPHPTPRQPTLHLPTPPYTSLHLPTPPQPPHTPTIHPSYTPTHTPTSTLDPTKLPTLVHTPPPIPPPHSPTPPPPGATRPNQADECGRDPEAQRSGGSARRRRSAHQ